MITLKDIARECGVSANTVSCVVNNKPGEVSAQTRERVLAAMRRMGYRPSAAARRMVGKRTNTLGIADRYTANENADFYKAQVLEPMIRAARSSKWDVLYYSGHYDEGGYTAFLDGRSEGLVCFTGFIDRDEVAAIQQSGLPVVFIGETEEDQPEHGSAFIDVDNLTGAYLAAAHLLDLGHVRIAMMQGMGISGNTNRVRGFCRAIAERGLTVDEALLYRTAASQEHGYSRGLAVLSRPAIERPTAIFCFNDGLAMGLLRAAAEIGVRIPEELSVVGFDDIAPASTATPPLTTVRQPLGWIGRRSIEMLIGIIDNSLPPEYHEIVRPELIVRSSTMPPSS